MRARRWGLVATSVMLFAVLVAGLVSAGGPPSEPPGLARAIAAQEAHTDRLLAKSGVLGTAVGLGADGRHVVKIYIESAGVPGLPHMLDGVPVEVEVTGEFVAQGHSLTRPAPIGVSSGSERLIIVGGLLYCTVGTLGARVRTLSPTPSCTRSATRTSTRSKGRRPRGRCRSATTEIGCCSLAAST